MIIQNKTTLPLRKVGTDVFKLTLGQVVVTLTDLALVTIGDTKSVDPSGALVDTYSLSLPCNAIIQATGVENQYELISNPTHVFTVAEQTQVISNADGVIGNIQIDPASIDSQVIKYTFKNPNSYNTSIINDLQGVAICCEFPVDTGIPATVRHLIYSTLISKYGAVISADDEIGTGDVLENSSQVNNTPSVKTLSGIIETGGIIEIPNISSVLQVKCKRWVKGNLHKLMVSTSSQITPATDATITSSTTSGIDLSVTAPVVVGTESTGLFTSLWDKIESFQINASALVRYVLTFDMKTYVIHNGTGWLPVISNDPAVHGLTRHTWHVLNASGMWDDTNTLVFDTSMILSALQQQIDPPTAVALNLLTSADICSDHGFVTRTSSYLDIFFVCLDVGDHNISSCEITVDESGYNYCTIGENGSYEVCHKNENGKQLHTIVKKSTGLESITIDYL